MDNGTESVSPIEALHFQEQEFKIDDDEDPDASHSKIVQKAKPLTTKINSKSLSNLH